MTSPSDRRAYSIVGRVSRATFVPRPRLTVSQWADQHRVIPRGTSPEPGPWRTSRVPYLREPMDAISDPSVERVICMWASQLGKSDGLILNAIGYYVDQDPSPILLVEPTQEAVSSFVKERLEASVRETPALRGKISDEARDKKNTILVKQFPGGYLAMAWATSPVSLASRPIRVLLLDEIDRYHETVGNEGDPIALAVQRTSNFHNRKIVAVSTPTVDGLSPIARLYEDTDQRRLWVPCPQCGAYQVLEWSGITYKNNAGDVDLDDVYYRCCHCSGRIDERDRPAMLEACQWRPDNAGHRHRGYQLSALYSPWVRWRTLAEQWVRVNVDRDRRGLQEFINLRLGETWTEGGEQVQAEALESHREDYLAEVPLGVLLLTCGVDVQDNRLELEVVGWGLGRESWGVSYQVIAGDTSLDDAWARLGQVLTRSWKREDGAELPIWCTCVDSGGHRTSEVYEFTRRMLGRNVFAVKGYAGEGRPVAGKPSVNNQLRVVLYPVGVDGAKADLFSRLQQAEPGPGYCHFPRAIESGYDGSYYQGLCSERRVVKVRAGRPVREWKVIHSRNEPLDARVYATAALEILNPDLIALDAARQSGPSPTTPTTTRAPGRRVLSGGIR